MDVNGKILLFKKWDQNVSRDKIFSLFIVKFKKLGFSVPLKPPF